MIVTMLMWLALIYIACVVIWHLFVAIAMIFKGYADRGWSGAIGMAIVIFLINLWNFSKFAFGLLIIILVVRGCSK